MMQLMVKLGLFVVEFQCPYSCSFVLITVMFGLLISNAPLRKNKEAKIWFFGLHAI